MISLYPDIISNDITVDIQKIVNFPDQLSDCPVGQTVKKIHKDIELF